MNCKKKGIAMGLNILEAAEACNQIYLDPAKTGSKIGDWSLVYRINSPHDDMTGNSDAYRVYYKKLEVLFVIRGSDRDSDWTRNNARIAINARPAKLHEVYNHCQFFKRLSPRSDFYITGHSLGGGLTQVVGYYTDSMFVAFNPPSMRNSVTGSCNMKPKAAPEPKMKPKNTNKPMTPFEIVSIDIGRSKASTSLAKALVMLTECLKVPTTPFVSAFAM
jgi:hypothetical protein